MVGGCAKAFRHRIREQNIGVAENLEIRRVVRRQQGNQVSSDRVIAEVRRQIANPQAAVWVFVVGEGGNGAVDALCQILGHL